MRHVVVGLNVREAQAYAIENLRGERVRIVSADHAVPALQGVGTDTTIHCLTRCYMARGAVALSQQLQVLRARGVEIKSGEL